MSSPRNIGEQMYVNCIYFILVIEISGNQSLSVVTERNFSSIIYRNEKPLSSVFQHVGRVYLQVQ